MFHILIILTPLTWGYCLLLKNQECTVRQVKLVNVNVFIKLVNAVVY